MPEERALTAQEITALRKDGNLEVALKHARELHAANEGVPWAVITLFWCLHDEHKRLRRAGNKDGLAALREEVGKLKLPEGDNNKLMQDCAARILGKTSDDNPVSKASQLSKEGKHHDAVSLILPLTQEGNVSLAVGEAYGWILYRKLKDTKKTDNEAAADAEAIKWCLEEFTRVWSPEWEPNAMLFKCILIQLKNKVEGWEGLPSLLDRINLDKLSPSEFADVDDNPDFEPFQDQLLKAINSSLKRHASLRHDQPGILRLMDAWADSFGDGRWPEYHRARILHWLGGDPELIRNLLVRCVRRIPTEYWIWHALAESLEGEERKAAMSRAITCESDDESYKIPVYHAYADLLAAEGELPAAKAAFDEAMRLRKLAGREWREPAPAWHEQADDGEEIDIREYARGFSDESDRLITSELDSKLCVLVRPLQKKGRFLFWCEPGGMRRLSFADRKGPGSEIKAIEATFENDEDSTCNVLAWKPAELPGHFGSVDTGVVGHVNRNKGLASVSTADHDFIPLHFDRWPAASKLQTGSFVSLRHVNDDEGKAVVVLWKETKPAAIPGLVKEVDGRFKLAHGKPFGFIKMEGQDVFVAPDVAASLQDGQNVQGWAMRSTDKGRASWKLLPVNPESETADSPS